MKILKRDREVNIFEKYMLFNLNNGHFPFNIYGNISPYGSCIANSGIMVDLI